MNKYIKQLVESFFDDMFDEKDTEQTQDDNTLLGDIQDKQETEDDLTIKTVFRAMNFTECRNENDFVDAFLEKDEFLDWYNNNINNLITYIKTNKICNVNEYLYNKTLDFSKTKNISYQKYREHMIYNSPIGKEIYFKFAIKEEVYNRLTLWVLYIQFYHYEYAREIQKEYPIFGYHISKQPKYSGHVTKAPSNRTISIENSFNTSEGIFNGEKYKECIQNYFLKIDNFAQKALREINYEPFVSYEISQKDIDRMTKLWQTKKVAGFEAITKLDKIIPRWAAGLYVNPKFKDYKYNDETLIEWCNGKFPLKGCVNSSLLNKVYLKDILDTLESR